MLAYAASAPRSAARRSSPNALLAIIAGHVALIAVVMSAKMDLPARILNRPIEVTLVPSQQPPPPDQPPPPKQPQQSAFTQPDSSIPLPPLDARPIDPTPPTSITDPSPGPSVDSLPQPRPAPVVPVSIGARLLTSGAALKPPYPQAKLLAEEEATLRLRLTIDEQGRVTAVEPVGRADPVFLDAARRYLLAHWRYQPATRDGRAVSSTEVITLSFQLDG